MKCTVLLPVFNGAETLAQAIESILRQSESDFELILIDDKSTDASADLIRTYMRRDDRVVGVFHGTNLGLAATLNEGLERARAGLIVRMDQDDESLPDRIRLQVDFMAAHPEVVVAGSHVYHMAKRKQYDRLVRVPLEHEKIVHILQSSNCMYHPSTIMRKAAVLDAGGYRADFENAEDYELWLRLSRKYRLANVDVPLLRYRFSTDGMTLGRNWQQLLYVQKAILSHTQPQLSASENEKAAYERREAIGKDYFFEQVAQGTIEELMRLRLWGDAVRVYGRFSRQIPLRRSGRLLWYCVKRIPSVRNPQEDRR